MMATSYMLPNPMACCASCDVTQAPDTLRDVIPLTDALRDVISLSSHCHSLMATPRVTSCPLQPPPIGVTLRNGRSPQDTTSESLRRPPSPPRVPKRPPSFRSAGATATGVPKDVDGVGELPRLRVSSRDLRYRGEGAEHIVLRVLTSGQVLRLRKTPVGAVTSKEDLVIRAKRDEEFLCNVARPILGPLLTDESRLVRLESDTVRELKNTIGPKRQAQRRHKEINNEGVACICPDAASIFISRYSPTLSSSPTSSSSSAHLSPSSSSSHEFTLTSSSSLSTTTSFEQGLDRVQEVHHNGREVQVIASRAFVSHEISQETKGGLNLRTNQPPSTSSSLNGCHVEATCSASSSAKNAVPREMPDVQERDTLPMYSFSDSSSVPVSMKPQNICIEIKPKQGFIDTSTPELPLCRYCVKQYIKVGKDADHATSRYCPLDLFSGNLVRMRKAVEGLLESPQNNLKVFVDGESVDNCLSFRYLRDIIITALIYDFTTAKAELREDGHLSPWSPLGRTLAFQTLDQLGVFSAANLYSHLVKVIGQAKAADALLQDLKCWTGDSQFCQSSNEWCTRCTQDDRQQTNGSGDLSSRKHSVASVQQEQCLVEDSPPVVNVSTEYMTSDKLSELITNANPKDTFEPMKLKRDASEHKIVGDSSSFMQDDIIRKLQEYLLSTTAKDLSLMILLSGPHRSAPTPSNAPNSSPFIIELEPGVWFRCQVTGVDLVAKPPSKILKHEQDYMNLKSVLEDLKRQGKEPSCCRQ